MDAALELAKKKYLRSAGVLAGVVLEKHLGQVYENHSIKITKKNATIGDLNNALKEVDIIDTPQWRFIQHLADLRNLCGHDKRAEPSAEQIDDIIAGTRKVLKTLF